MSDNRNRNPATLVRWHPNDLAELDTWIARQRQEPGRKAWSRADAIRLLTLAALRGQP